VSEEEEEEADDFGDSESDISEESDDDIRGGRRGGAALSSGRKAVVPSVPASVSVPLKVAESSARGNGRPQRARAAKLISVDESDVDEVEDNESVGNRKAQAPGRSKRGRDASPPARPSAKRSGTSSSSSVQTRLDGGGLGGKKRVAGLTEDW
jgi:hypothetical protein